MALGGNIRFLVVMLASPGQRKHIYRWLRSLRRDFLLEAGLPWITFDAMDYIQAWLPSGARVFEYGSGGSTLFWLRLGATCVSVEHDPTWYARVRQRLGQSAPIDYRLVLPEPGNVADGEVDDPSLYLSADPAFQGFSFRKYVSQIDEYPDDYFDLILIDGRARPSCLAHSVAKVKPGGLIVLDNAERSYYTARTSSLLQGFKRRSCWGVGPQFPWMWQTDLYERASSR